MDIRAILLIGGIQPKHGEVDRALRQYSARLPRCTGDVGGRESSATAAALRHLRLQPHLRISLRRGAAVSSLPFSRSAKQHRCTWRVSNSGRRPSESFMACAEDGAELVIVHAPGRLRRSRLRRDDSAPSGSPELRDPGRRFGEQNTLDLFVLSASARMDAAELFQSRLQHLRRESEPFPCQRLRQSSAKTSRSAATGRGRAAGAQCGRSARQRNETRNLVRALWRGFIEKPASSRPPISAPHSKIRASALITEAR